MEKDRIRFLYLQDPYEEGHIATIARRVVGDEVEFSYALNKVTQLLFEDDISPRMQGAMTSEMRTEVYRLWYKRFGGDNFTKGIGRSIAEGRLETGNGGKVFTIPFVAHKQTIQDILTFLSEHPLRVPKHLRALALDIINQRPPPPEPEEAKLQATG